MANNAPYINNKYTGSDLFLQTGDNEDALVIEDDESMEEGLAGLQQQSAIVASSQVESDIDR